MATAAYEKPLLDISLVAAADYSAKQFYVMAQNSSGQAVLVSSQGQRPIGILQDDPESGKVGLVRVSGVSKGLLGGTVAYDDPLTADANGKLIKATNNGEAMVGRAMSSGSSGEVIPVLMIPSGSGFVNNGSFLSFHLVLSKISNADVISAFTPGFAGTIKKMQFITTDPVTTGSKLATLTPYIGSTAVTGGVVALTSALCTPLGAVVAGSAVTALNQFASTDTIKVVASSVTAFVEGQGTLLISLA